MAYKRSYADLKVLAKRANQRMRELEKAGIKSPAYEAAQAVLEMMGKKKTTDGGRRFSEGTMYTYNEYEAIKSAVENFLSAKTSTKKGHTSYVNNMWSTADEKYDLSSHGITKDEYFELFKALPQKHKDRMLSSTQYMAIVERVQKKQAELEPEDRMSVTEIIEEIKSMKTLKGALTAVGLTIEEYDESPVLEA